MHRLSCRPIRRSRRGLSLSDVLAVVVAIAMVASVILPSILSARAAARRLQCLNNVKGLGTAVSNYQARSCETFPPLADESRGWPLVMLSELGPLGSEEEWRANAEPQLDSIQPHGPGSVPVVAARFFACPDDEGNFRVPGGLSYGANAGYINSGHWDGDDTDHRVGSIEFPAGNAAHRATGLFWRPNAVDGSRVRMTGEFVSQHDGLSTTLMFAENPRCRNWGSLFTRDLGIGVRLACNGATPASPTNPSERGAYEFLKAQEGWDQYRGSSLIFPSHHEGGVLNVSFADGHGSCLSPQIDPAIYARLLSPAGEDYGEERVSLDEIE